MNAVKRRVYLPVEIDGRRKCAKAASFLNVHPGLVSWALQEAWEYAWREKSGGRESPDILTELELLACLGPLATDARAVETLVGFGFIESVEGGYRVRGARDWLFGQSESGSVGGKKTASLGKSLRNLKQNQPKALRSDTEGAFGKTDESAEGSPKPTQHPTPNTKESKPLSPSGDADRVFEHWQVAMNHPRAVFDSTRRTKVEARLKEGRTVEELCAAVDGCARTPHNMGQNERGEIFDDLELICRNDKQVERFIRNAASPPGQKGGSLRPSGDLPHRPKAKSRPFTPEPDFFRAPTEDPP